jgi:enoyl-CoA hydratase/carnithine racemase
METSFVLYKVEHGIATITMNRPERRNALSAPVYTALVAALQSAKNDADVRVAILTGANGFFTAGNDLSEFIGFKRGHEFAVIDFLKAIASFPKPLIAAVERGAVGIGVTLLQHCDFVYLGRSTKMSMPFAPFGICVEGGASRIMAHGPQARQALRWLMLGDPLTADDAVAAGFGTSVVDDGGAHAKAQETAARIAAMDARAVQKIKEQIRRHQPGMEKTLQDEADDFTTLLEGDAAQRAIRAFVEKQNAKKA